VGNGRPRLLIYTANYWPEPAGFAPMTTDLAETLAGSDWDVTVLTGLPMAPQWRVYEGYRSRRGQLPWIQGIGRVIMPSILSVVPAWVSSGRDQVLRWRALPIECVELSRFGRTIA
jgi:hypothetical protein